METTKSASRLPRLVYLVQTDTTVGFCSQDALELNSIKERPLDKQFLKTYPSLEGVVKDIRVPQKFKNSVRRSKRVTFVVKDRAFRVVKSGFYSKMLSRFNWLYSTSANLTSQRFCNEFARESADVVVEDESGLFESEASSIYKLGVSRKIGIR